MVKKRTTKFILEGLPEPYRSQALANLVLSSRAFKVVYFSDLVAWKHVICDALSAGFVWDKTDQGKEYWMDVYKKIKNEEI